MVDAEMVDAEALLVDFPIVVRVPVHWGEMDAFGHVNNIIYFRYCETARILYFERCGFMASYEDDHIGAILHSTSCRFRRPLHFPDTVLTGTRVTDLEDDRFTMAYRVVSLDQQAIAAEGSGLIVSYDYTGREKTSLPDPVRGRILELEGR